MTQLQSFLGRNFLGNTVQSYLTAAAAFFLVLYGLYIIRAVGVARLKAMAEKTRTDLDDFLIDLIGKIRTPEYHFIAFYIATRSLTLSGAIDKVITISFVVVLSYRAIRLLQAVVGYGARKLTAGEPEDPTAAAVMKNLILLADGLIWVAGVLFVLNNLGVNITAMVAGLGIGGMAVALAAQAILGDLFSSLSIYLDKPFVIGDFIIVGDLMGTVEHVGIKTTRVRSLSGELLVFANSDLTASRIRNFKQMYRRRVVFALGVTYQTPHEKMKAVPVMVREIFQSVRDVSLDRVHFKFFGDFSLNFEIVYYVLDPDYNVYMDKQQEINLALMKRFEKETIEFAYPTQTVFVQSQNGAART